MGKKVVNFITYNGRQYETCRFETQNYKLKNKFDMKNKLSIKQRIKACFILLVSGSLPLWWWSDLSNKFYESKIAHDYKDGKFDYRTIRAWFLEQ
ncbi:hypothetical protein M0Q97_05005 [Candidatus Dojkabacteria bacterium]|jgi:hypothetical protein|nr:hypothetical protein [Candidatus Dojkabacteria bacterium]